LYKPVPGYPTKSRTCLLPPFNHPLFYLCAFINPMRIVKEISHPRFKITVFSWNNKYIIKIEDAHLEQIYKIDEGQVSGLHEIEQMMNTPFLLKVLERFAAMGADFNDTWRNRYKTKTEQ